VKVRFQADADLNEDIVTGVLRREPQVDFRTATAAGLGPLSDLEVLTLAAREGRVLVSHDRRTMPRAFAGFVSLNASPGLLICVPEDGFAYSNRPAAFDLVGV
jgi:hypothetical protein